MEKSDKHKYKTGDRVTYVDGLGKHESGTVTSVNDNYVFVMFDKYTAQHCTSQACKPDDLF